MWQRKTDRRSNSKRCFHHPFPYCLQYKPHTLYWLQWTYQTNTVYRISGIESSSFNLSPTSRPPEEIWRKATWGEARKTLSLSPVSAVWEKSIEVSVLDSSIFYCVNLTPHMGKGRWVGGLRGRGEGVSEAGRCTGGEKEVRDGEVKELFIHKVFVHSHRLE